MNHPSRSELTVVQKRLEIRAWRARVFREFCSGFCVCRCVERHGTIVCILGGDRAAGAVPLRLTGCIAL